MNRLQESTSFLYSLASLLKTQDKEALERIEDSEKSLKGLPKSRCRESEDSKEPGESKEEHHSTDADHQTYDGFVADCFLLSSSRAPSVTNQNHHHPDEDDHIEDHNR